MFYALAFAGFKYTWNFYKMVIAFTLTVLKVTILRKFAPIPLLSCQEKKAFYFIKAYMGSIYALSVY